ncbi:unnamed protein product [Rhodiola kirilowii]
MKHDSPESSSSAAAEALSSGIQLGTATMIAADQSHQMNSASAVEDPTVAGRDGGGGGLLGQEMVVVEKRGEFATVCKWTVQNFPKIKARALWSKYFEVGGYDCRLLVYPKGDSQALPGYISIYLQILDPRGTSSSKWDCFASYRLAIVNVNDETKTIHRDSWHRFSTKKKSHGWCDFTPSAPIFDPKAGYMFYNNESVLITADILILNETVNFTRDNIEMQSPLPVVTGPSSGDVLSGKFSWKVHNFSLFKEMIKTQKIMSPLFPAGECNLRISVYQSSVNGIEYLSMCLESKDTEKNILSDRSCWCLFRMSVLNQKQGLTHMHRDSYGRFAADNKSGDNTSLGWNDYMKMSDFVGPDSGYLVDDTAVFSTSFHVIKEHSSFLKNGGPIGVRGGAKKSDGHMGKFIWKIENFTKLKDLLKKRKITGLCIKSRRFRIGNRDCRLIVYPRGQSQPPCHLSVFLEVTDSRNTSSDWSCFVSHRLSVVNQKMEEKSVTKESQNRYSKAAKDWGWREFVTLTSLFDQDSGFLVMDTVVFSAEVLILKETSIMQDFTKQDAEASNTNSVKDGKRCSFSWKVENFLSFKEIMETRKIFSKFFEAGGCELRIGVYESFDTICIYLESDQSAGSDPDKNYWVRYRMAVINQKNPTKTVWKESSICTKTWNNSVLQFMKVSDMLEADAGFLVRDTVIFVCEILDCCPWFDFSDLEVLASEDEQDAVTTDPDEVIDSDDSEGISGDEEDMFRNLLSRAGFHLTYGDNPSEPQVTLREKLLMDAGAIAGFLTGLRVYLDDPAKVKRLLLPTKISGNNDGKKITESNESSPSLMNLLMGVKVLQQAIIDLLLDIMVECCQPSEGSSIVHYSDPSTRCIKCVLASTSSDESDTENEISESPHCPLNERLDAGLSTGSQTSAVQSSDTVLHIREKGAHRLPIFPPEATAGGTLESPSFCSKAKWPEESEELLGLIVNSLRALDGAVPQGCPEPRRRPKSAQKIAVVLDKAPKHLQPDLVALVPRLVEQSEHPLAARALLERLQKPDAEPSLRLPVLGALSQLECDSEVWERVLIQSVELMGDSMDEPLVATISYVFKAASECQRLSEAVRSVRVRLRSIGAEVSPCVLDYLSRTVSSCGEVAEAILRDIDNDDNLGEDSLSIPSALFSENLPTARKLQALDELAYSAFRHFSDIYMLIEMLSIPCFAVRAAQTFEKAIARGAIIPQAVAAVLERRLAQSLHLDSRSMVDTVPKTDIIVDTEAMMNVRRQQDDFNPVLGLAEKLSLSPEPLVKGFAKMLYIILYKWFADESYRVRMLKRLVDRVITSTDNSREIDIVIDIMVTLVSEDKEVIRPIMIMMREVAELANADRAALWHQLCVSEDEIVRLREEKKAETSSMVKEKAALTQRLSETEAANSRLKTELRSETDRFAKERKNLSEQLQEMEGQLEWLRAERDEEIEKLTAENNVLQDRLRDSESQLSQLKSRKREELKKVVKEKNALAERLKGAESARKRFDEELKRYATENVSREEVRQSLENEVRRLTQTVGQTEKQKREKEEQVARCETYIDGMESKLQACQQYIQTLESSLHEEMSRHAPLYGAGLEALSLKELETLSRIHEDGLRQIHALQQHKTSTTTSGSPHNLLNTYGLYPNQTTTQSQMPVTVPPSLSLLQNGAGIHNNGHANGSVVGPWFNQS